MLVSVAKRMAVASLVGPSQAARPAGVELAANGVVGDDRVVDQEAEADDERGERDLLDIEAEESHQAEGHRERDRNREREHGRRAPLPEADEADDDDDDDGFEEAAHEAADLLFDLLGLIGDLLDAQVFGQRRPRRRDRGLDARAHVGDLCVGQLLDTQRDGARAHERACRVAGRERVAGAARVFVAARHVEAVAEPHGLAAGGARDHRAGDGGLAVELAARVDGDGAGAGLGGGAHRARIFLAEGAGDVVEADAAGLELFAIELDVETFGDRAAANDLGDPRRRLEPPLERLGEAIELGEGVRVAAHARQLGAQLGGPADGEGGPGIGVHPAAAAALGEQTGARGFERGGGQRGAEQGEAGAGGQVRRDALLVGEQAGERQQRGAHGRLAGAEREGHDQRRRRGRAGGAPGAEGARDLDRAGVELGVAGRGARHRIEKNVRVAEVFLEVRRRRAGRQLDLAQLQLEIVELFVDRVE